MREIRERNLEAEKEWIASLLDRAIETGREEMRGRVERTLGPFVAATVTRSGDWTEMLEMDLHMFVRYDNTKPKA
jgi:hypothetical protein